MSRVRGHGPAVHRRRCRREHDPAMDRGGTTPGRAPAASPYSQPGRTPPRPRTRPVDVRLGVLPGSRRPSATPRRSRCAGHRGVPRPLREVITASACPSMAARASGSCPASSVKEIPPDGSRTSASRWCNPRGPRHLTRAPHMHSRCVVVPTACRAGWCALPRLHSRLAYRRPRPRLVLRTSGPGRAQTSIQHGK